MHSTNSFMNVNVTAVVIGLEGRGGGAITRNAFLFETLMQNLPWDALLTHLR